MSKKNVYSFQLPPHENAALREWCLDRGYPQSAPPQYAAWKCDADGFNIVCYNSGKIVVQGKGAEEFVRYTLETLCPSTAGISDGANIDLSTYIAHAGLDESGKGDFFGPLVICCAYVDKKNAEALIVAGAKDCKLLNDKEVFAIDTKIRNILTGRNFATVLIGSEAYNRLYEKFGNLNKLLAWGHARALENILEKVPSCGLALADQFGNPQLIERALLNKGRHIKLEQRHKAESDIAVAAASVIARAEFLRRLEALGKQIGTRLPKGAGDPVLKTGKALWEQRPDPDFFATFAKCHFATFYRVQGLPPPQKPAFYRKKS